MNKLTALIEAAKAANAFCNKCGYLGPDEPTHQGCDYMAKRTAVVPADTILELCALLEKAEEGLSLVKAGSTPAKFIASTYLAAIKQWKEKADAIRGLA